MKKFLAILVLVIPLAGFMGCSSDDGTSTPRQTAAQVDDSYAAVQVLALNAIQSGQLSDAIEAQIKVAAQASADAVLAYHDAATRCAQGADYTIGDAPSNPPGVHCDDSLIGLTQGAAVALIGNLKQLLAAFGK